MKRRTGLVAALLALLVAGGIFWWLESSTRPPAVAEPDVAVVKGPGHVAPDALATGLTFPPPESGSVPTDPAATVPTGKPTVGDILAEPDEDYVRVAKKLTAITLDPQAPMAEREEALAHALNLSAGNEAEVLTPLVKDPNLPDELADTVLAEALNRSLAYQADLYLAALAARKSPEMQQKIREHLAFLTDGEDRGANPADWLPDIKKAKENWPE